MSMIFEDITNEALSSSVTDSTGRRLKNTHRRALRAHHLHHNRFVRPRRLANRRRLDDDADTTNNLMDALSITGGYNGVELYIRLELDVSKLAISSIDDLVKQPFSHLENVEFLTKLFATSNSIGDEPALNTSVSFSAGAHVSIRGAYILMHFRHALQYSATCHTYYMLFLCESSGNRFNSLRSKQVTFLKPVNYCAFIH
jgi:hypothetical protein